MNVGKTLPEAAQQRIIGVQGTTDFIVRGHAHGLGKIEFTRRAGDRLLHRRQRPRNRAPQQTTTHSENRQPGERHQCRHQQRTRVGRLAHGSIFLDIVDVIGDQTIEILAEPLMQGVDIALDHLQRHLRLTDPGQRTDLT